MNPYLSWSKADLDYWLRVLMFNVVFLHVDDFEALERKRDLLVEAGATL